jgi:hypothetical protein
MINLFLFKIESWAGSREGFDLLSIYRKGLKRMDETVTTKWRHWLSWANRVARPKTSSMKRQMPLEFSWKAGLSRGKVCSSWITFDRLREVVGSSSHQSSLVQGNVELDECFLFLRQAWYALTTIDYYSTYWWKHEVNSKASLLVLHVIAVLERIPFHQHVFRLFPSHKNGTFTKREKIELRIKFWITDSTKRASRMQRDMNMTNNESPT